MFSVISRGSYHTYIPISIYNKTINFFKKIKNIYIMHNAYRTLHFSLSNEPATDIKEGEEQNGQHVSKEGKNVQHSSAKWAHFSKNL